MDGGPVAVQRWVGIGHIDLNIALKEGVRRQINVWPRDIAIDLRLLPAVADVGIGADDMQGTFAGGAPGIHGAVPSAGSAAPVVVRSAEFISGVEGVEDQVSRQADVGRAGQY